MLLAVANFSGNAESTEFKMVKDEVLPDISLFFFLIASALSCIFPFPDLFLSLLRIVAVSLFFHSFFLGDCWDIRHA
jgi:hypothetical protein